jgi:hypothetical protein
MFAGWNKRRVERPCGSADLSPHRPADATAGHRRFPACTPAAGSLDPPLPALRFRFLTGDNFPAPDDGGSLQAAWTTEGFSMSTGAPAAVTPPNPPPAEKEDKVILVPLPKIVFLWPTLVVSLLSGIYMSFSHPQGSEGPVIAAVAFLATLAMNLIVLSFDFPRTTSLTVFFVLVALFLGGALMVVYYPTVLPWLNAQLVKIRPVANATFYFVFATMMLLIYLGVAITVRFDYWEVRGNELLHHHGFLSDLERFPAPALKIDKEIKDVFEYLLLGSGRLILHPSNEPRAIVLENIAWITRKEKAITNLLGTLQVRVRQNKAIEDGT